MDYPSDSRAHDSGYFTPSPDKENKLTSTLINYPQLETLNNCILNNPNVRNSSKNGLEMTNQQPKMVHNIGNNHDMDRPPHSYIALISMAILSKSEKKILLNEIYDWVVQNFPYYQHRTDKSWRNSIRHNLSLNECFIKVGKAGNGRGYYWSIHPANITDFKKGDFRRRQARLRAKHDAKVAISTNNSSNNSTLSTSNNDGGNSSQSTPNRSSNNRNMESNSLNANNSTTVPSLSQQATSNNNMLHNTNLNLTNHYLDASNVHNHHHHHHSSSLNNSNVSSTMPNSNLCSPNTNTGTVAASQHHHHHQLINNEANNYHSNMNLNCIGSPVSVPHNIQPMSSSIYSHHHSTPNQQSHHHQYNYVAFNPWLTAAAAAQQIQSSTNNFLESFTSSALAYNSIIPHAASAAYAAASAAPNEMTNDNSAPLYYHNFHNK